MLRTELRRKMLYYTWVLILATLVSLTFSIDVSLVQGSSVYFEQVSHNILRNDVVTVYIQPIVEKLSVDVSPISPNMQSRVYFAVNESDSSIIQMQPQSEGTYNLTITFETNRTWSYTVGVYTETSSFYREYGNHTHTISGTFVEFFNRKVEGSTGKATLVLILDSYSPDSSSLFNFSLPRSVNALIFIVVTLAIGYVNAFTLYDTYFRNKREGTSKKRWVLLILLIIVSVFVIYEVYLYTTFSSPVEVLTDE
jgi:hypothetical protein